MCNLHEPSFEALLPRPGAQQVSRHKQQKQDGNFEIFGIKYKFCIFPENAMEIIQEIQQTIVIELRLHQ